MMLQIIMTRRWTVTAATIVMRSITRIVVMIAYNNIKNKFRCGMIFLI